MNAMRERLEQLGGGLTVDAMQPGGFHLKAWFPVSDSVEAQ